MQSIDYCEVGLVVSEPWLTRILEKGKLWEMRSNRVNRRGPIALVKKGSGRVVGIARLVDVKGPFSTEKLADHESKHQIPPEIYRASGYKWHYAWVLQAAIALPSPVPYRHKSGAVIWVGLDEDVQQAIADQLQSLGWSSSSDRSELGSSPSITPNRSNQANPHSAGRAESEAKLPIAKDGSFFCREACWRASGYTVGEKGAEQHFQDFEAALDYLRDMPVAKWRRPNQNGNWGIVSAVDWIELDGSEQQGSQIHRSSDQQ